MAADSGTEKLISLTLKPEVCGYERGAWRHKQGGSSAVGTNLAACTDGAKRHTGPMSSGNVTNDTSGI